MAQAQSTVNQQPSILLLRYVTNPGLFCGSPWANRLDALLTLSRTDFTYGRNMANNRKSKTGRIPYLLLSSLAEAKGDSKDLDEMLCDSERAYDELVKRGIAQELDADLSAHEVATGRLVEALVKQLAWGLEKERWLDNYTTGRDTLMARLSWPVRMIVGYMVYRSMAAKLNAIEIGQLDGEAFYQLVANGYDALVDLVTGLEGKAKDCVLGREAPTRVDALVFAIIAAPLQTTFWNPVFGGIIRDRPILMHYAEGMRKTWWPNRPALLEE